jgi:hypothetical protein
MLTLILAAIYLGHRRAASSSYWPPFLRRGGVGNGHICVDFIFLKWYGLFTF